MDFDDDLLHRIMLKVDITGCWEWRGEITNGGYGLISHRGKSYGVHRFVYLLCVGPIPDGYHVDHLCKVRHCVNPDHLEAVTPHENWLRSDAYSAVNARKTECKRGHPFTPENTLVTPVGTRACRACRRMLQQGYRARDKEGASA